MNQTNQMDQNQKKTKFLWGASLAAVFACMFVFFYWKHPMYIYDTDDWYYISRVRLGVPIPKFWNPTRVLPEVLMPLTAEIGVDFFYPLSGDYIGSIALSTALVLCTCITIYITAFVRFLKKENKLSNAISLLLLPGVLLLHFLPFFNSYFGYAHMFYAHDVSCIFYYVIASLLNACLVFYFWNREDVRWMNKDKVVRNGFLILLIYVCLCSNLFQSIIFMSYIGMSLSERFILALRKKQKGLLKKYVKANLDRLLILLAWFGVLILEATGGRSDSLASEVVSWKNAVILYFDACKHLHKFFWLLLIGLFALAALTFLLTGKKRKQDNLAKLSASRFWSNVGRCAFCFFLTSVFLILLCAKVNSNYIVRPYVIFGVVFYLMLIMLFSLGYLLENLPQTALLIPVIYFVLVSELVVTRENYADIYDPVITKAVGEEMIRQVVAGDEAGVSVLRINYPDNGSTNWPFEIWNGGEKIYQTLYRHGIVKHQMTVYLEPSLEMAQKYHVDELEVNQ